MVEIHLQVSRPERRLAMLPNVILLVFAALVSSFLWWRTRFKICRRCRSRIGRWESVCHVCGAEQKDGEQSARGMHGAPDFQSRFDKSTGQAREMKKGALRVL